MLPTIVKWSWLVAVHVLLVALLISPELPRRVDDRLDLGIYETPEISPHYKSMMFYHRSINAQLEDAAVVFIGDSITQALNTSAVAENSINFGIGGDTTRGVLRRVPKYTSLSRASTIVLTIGFNDLRRRSNAEILGNYARILSILPSGPTLVLSGVLPVDETAAPVLAGYNERISSLNRQIRELRAKRPRTVFFDAGPELSGPDGNLESVHHIGDGVHLSTEGYAVWTEALELARVIAAETI